VTIGFGPHGPDTSSGVFVTVYQRSSPLLEYHAIDAATPGLIRLAFSSDRPDPFVIRLTNDNSRSATPIQFTVTRAST
jgi:hypothetical protein